MPDHDQISGLLGGSMENLLSDPTTPLPFWNSYRAKDGTSSSWR